MTTQKESPVVNQNNQKTITEETAEKLLDLLTKAPTATVNKSIEFAKKPVLHIRNSQILAGITASVGLIMFALGIENLIANVPGLSSPVTETVLGLILLSISGLFLKKLL